MCYPQPGPRCSKHAFAELIETEKKFSAASTPQEKLILGRKLEEKREAYETTPRGISDLRRQADTAEGIKKEELLLRMRNGETRRKKMLDDYHYVNSNTKDAFKDLMQEKGLASGSKYQQACGITLMYLSHRLTDIDFHINSMDTIISDTDKIFIAPEKYQDKWSNCHFDGKKYHGASPNLLELLNKHSNLGVSPTLSAEKAMFDWFKAALYQENYTAFATVNRKTQDVVISDIERLDKFYNIRFKLRPRIAGSQAAKLPEEELKTLLKDTLFEDGIILTPKGAGRQVVSDVAQQPKELCEISEDLYLSWRPGKTDDDFGGWFELRRRGKSDVYEIWVLLEAKQILKTSGIYKDSGLFIKEEPEYIDEEYIVDEDFDFGEPKFNY